MNPEQQKMRCTSCGATWFSAAAVELVDKGELCMRCDGRLELVEEDGANGPAEQEAPETNG